jgi:predicted acylesterase/phospholipase RssA
MVPILILSILRNFASGQCLGLVIEGGGAKGSYEAGVLSVITDPSKGINVKYNIMTGISIGALTLNSIGGFPQGQELEMSQFLNQMWFNITDNSDLFTEWKGGLIEGLLFQQGLYNNDNGIEFYRRFSKSPLRNVTVGSTNLDYGLFENFNESVGLAFLDASISSASIPFFFPPHKFVGFTWADGGCILNLDIPLAVERCLTVTDESSITIDILMDNFHTSLSNSTSFKTPQVFERAYQISQYDKSIWYLYNSMLAYPKVIFRYLFAPSQPLSSTLNFTKAAILENFNVGVKDAEDVISESGHQPQEMMKNWFSSLSKIEFP